MDMDVAQSAADAAAHEVTEFILPKHVAPAAATLQQQEASLKATSDSESTRIPAPTAAAVATAPVLDQKYIFSDSEDDLEEDTHMTAAPASSVPGAAGSTAAGQSDERLKAIAQRYLSSGAVQSTAAGSATPSPSLAGAPSRTRSFKAKKGALALPEPSGPLSPEAAAAQVHTSIFSACFCNCGSCFSCMCYVSSLSTL
jgi:hypothetical protein